MNPNDATEQTTFEVILPKPILTKGQQEYQAFLRLLPSLLATHQGKYVAVHEGEVIDSDDNDIVLSLRVRRQIGLMPIHIGIVAYPQPVARIPHYREYKP
jgi:hypothetical protein